jgi:hypothetical protein
MTDFLREVDEEYRRSQAEQVWKKYGSVIIALCVVLVAGVAGWRYFDWQKQQAAAAAGGRFDAALQQLSSPNAAEGEAAMAKIAGESDGIYRRLAELRVAGEIAKRDPVAALRSLDTLANDTTLSSDFRDLARLRAATIAVDRETLADVERRLVPLTSATNPWRFQALELQAAAAMKADAKDKARQFLDQIIIDRAAPPGVKARAELLIGLTR